MMNDSESDCMTTPTESEIFVVFNNTCLHNPNWIINAQKNVYFIQASLKCSPGGF